MRRGLLLIACVSLALFLFACGSSSSPPPPVIMVSVLPASVNLNTNQTQTFTATVTGTTNVAVNWQVNGVAGGNATAGTITATGLYTAPATVPTPATVTVSAVSQADATKSGTASATIARAVNVIVNPSPAFVEVFTSQQFNATVNGVLNNSLVNWQVNGVTGGSASTGTISATGLFTAPNSVPVTTAGGASQTTTVTVTAVSQANANSSGSSVVTVTPPPKVQGFQGNPIVLGTSGGNRNDSSTSGSTITCCGGTLGSLVTRGGTQFILSNNHVLARSDLGTKTNGTTQGDAIIQPGLIDARCGQGPVTIIANLTDFFNLETGTGTKIDAAIAQAAPNGVDPNGTILELGATATSGIPDPGPPHAGSGVAPAMNMPVAKAGRSTGLTCSTILATGMTATVTYSKGCGTGNPTFTETFTGQIAVNGGDFSAQGDSGSLIVSQTTADPVALLFAGSSSDTVGNPVSDVLNFFSTAGSPMTFVGDTTPGGHAVKGCTGPFPLAGVTTVPNSLGGQVSTATAEQMLRATAVRDAHAPELFAHPEVQAIGVGASYDNPEEPAILFFVTKGAPRSNIPLQIDGIRTRIIEGDLFTRRGSLSVADSATLEQVAPPPQAVYSIPDAEVERAKVVHSAHVDELMNAPGVQGVGISSSVDSPGEAALMIFLVRGETHDPILPVVDGLRTRVRVSSRFRAGFGDKDRQPQRGCAVLPTRKSQASVTPGQRPRRARSH